MKESGTEEDRIAALTQQIRLLARQTAQAEAELQRLREAVATSHREREQRTAELVKRRDELQAAANAQEMDPHVKIDELTKTNRILTNGLNTIEKCIGRLSESRSFRFLAYGLSRLGLISHTPRRCVESIKDQLVAIRDAVRQMRSNVLAHAADREPVEVRSNHSATRQGSEFLSSTRHEPFVAPDYADVQGGKTGPAESGRDLVSNQPAAGTCPIDDENHKRRIEQAAHFRALACSRNLVSLPPLRKMGDDPSVCLIVLHRGGENHLRQLFSSFLEVNTWSNVECAVVLHSCTDNSRDVIKSFQNRLKIKVIEYDKNYSFAYSNNRAAEQTSAEYLVFCNNDIVFQSNLIPELLRLLGDSRNGIVGTRLLFPSDHSKYPNSLQHGGVKFRPDRLHFFHRPWNVGVYIDNFGTPAVPEEFPAVTGALAACRRRDFLKVGGFCESYFYGYEDVDLCLSFRRILGLRSISANHVAGTHNESVTGSADTRETIIQRRSNNMIHLVRRHGWYLRRQIALDTISGNLFFSDKPLTVAFALTEAKSTTASNDFAIASQLGQACVNEFGWEVRYVASDADWYNLKEVDVLVVLFDSFDLAKVRNAEPDLIKIAWLHSCLERWLSRQDFDNYDLVLCPSEKFACRLRETRGKPAWVFRLATDPEPSRGRVRSRHTYRRRARTLKAILMTRARRTYRIAIKIATANDTQVQGSDYHFGRSLGRCFAEQGHTYRIDCLDQWERPESFGDDVVIVLPGLARYEPKLGQINLMWNISHADSVSEDEYEQFDHVFLASQTDAEELSSRLRTSVSTLLESPAGEGVLANHTFAQQAIVILEKIRQIDSLKQKMEGLRNARAA